ncbi:hypothetical protein LLG95_07030 [bacterium]|nr:hypothetical protein [bacterium]
MSIRSARIPLFLIVCFAMSGEAWACAHCRFCIETNRFIIPLFATFLIAAATVPILKRTGLWGRWKNAALILLIAFFTCLYVGASYAFHQPDNALSKYLYELLLRGPVPAGESIFGLPESLNELQSGLFIFAALAGLVWIRTKWMEPRWARIPLSLGVLIIPMFVFAMAIAYMLPARTLLEASDRIDQSFLAIKLASIPIAIFSIKNTFFLIVCIVFYTFAFFGSGASQSLGIGIVMFLFGAYFFVFRPYQNQRN